MVNLLLNFSMISSHIDSFCGLALIGTPRYLKGTSINLQLRSRRIYSNIPPPPPKASQATFEKICLELNVSSKHLRIDFRHMTLCIESLAKNKVSSTNCKRETPTSSLPTKYPWKRLLLQACLINRLNPLPPSRTRMVLWDPLA